MGKGGSRTDISDGSRADGSGKPVGDGGYGTVGKGPLKLRGDHSGLGTYGKMYGDETLQKLYIGSGGGSGGNAKDLSVNPPGGRGGNGGGAIRLRALRNVLIGGIVTVAGMDGQGDAVAIPGCIPLCPKDCDHKSLLSCSGNSTSACWDSSGPGGGGSGGSLFISGKVVNVGQRSLLAMGGSGGYGTLQGCGGDGGMGRIRVEYVILKGSLTNDQGAISKSQLQNQFTDHSYEGQARIDYQNTVYGNEVYLGCFTDNDVNYRTLAHTVSLTSTQSNNMTPQLCMTLCRKAGYKYSGTEYSKECFCDNHLDVTRKVIDSQCNMHCRGDSKQICGDSFRVQVFGPHPGVSAVGHQGAVQTCDPWCVTADDGTSNVRFAMTVFPFIIIIMISSPCRHRGLVDRASDQ
ncbi:hypothetical protein FSP39_007118 [Pinctada imbricata]|uniref:WSC domain-containing protein n=1 Tax=Pinctada imbricata TaxID=66713 RepID=A0AA88YHV7_PINIB|nr:hypothetical protein FSP39_007118 [Pinctada imbricata]